MKTDELLTTAHEHILFVANRPDVVMARGKGMRLYDTEGNSYLDFVAGWAVNALGHSPKCIRKALKKQSKLLVNSSPAYYNEPMVEFAELITRISALPRVFFCSTGAEANESAIKLARKFGVVKKNGAYKIICMKGGFHGRTLATMSATGKENWKNLFEPKVPGFVHVALNDVDELKAAMTEDVCAVMLEPIQGEGGVVEASLEYLAEMRKLCSERNILLILDEVQTGLARTGKMFCCEHYGVSPDIMTLGKGIGGGFPLAAMLCTEELNIFDAGDQGGTYSSQPLAMAVGSAVIHEIIKKNLPFHAAFMETKIRDVLSFIAQKYPLSPVRGKGLLLAFDFDRDCAVQVGKEAFARGLLINVAPSSKKTIRLIPPLNLKEKHVDEMADKLLRAIKAVYR